MTGINEGLQPLEGVHTGADHEELQPKGKAHAGEVPGGLTPMGGRTRGVFNCIFSPLWS